MYAILTKYYCSLHALPVLGSERAHVRHSGGNLPVSQVQRPTHSQTVDLVLWSSMPHTSVLGSADKRIQLHHSQPISWLITEKLNQTQQKQTCITNKMYYNIKLTHKYKAKFGHLLRPPAWKQNRSILEGVDKSGSEWVRKQINKEV